MAGGLTTHNRGTEEIVTINHTECGMMAAHTETLMRAFRDKGIEWVWEVDTGHLRPPHHRLGQRVNNSWETGAK